VAQVQEVVQELLEVDPENEADSRNERAFRAWFNSLDIEREVNDLCVPLPHPSLTHHHRRRNPAARLT
jgi:hypothetical protein